VKVTNLVIHLEAQTHEGTSQLATLDPQHLVRFKRLHSLQLHDYIYKLLKEMRNLTCAAFASPLYSNTF
jgi:hypothetical protein